MGAQITGLPFANVSTSCVIKDFKCGSDENSFEDEQLEYAFV